jgi:hypothetical protein
LFVLAVIVFSFLTGAPTAKVAQGKDVPLPNLSELTAEWCKWLYSIPENSNPTREGNAGKVLQGQPYKGSKLYFLAAPEVAEVEITVPAGSAFFFPVLVCEWDNGATPPTSPDYFSLKEMYSICSGAMDAATKKFATLDGVNLQVQRLQSPPFACKLPKGNIAGLNIPVIAPAVSDGYWVFIPPLPKGRYELEFGGEIPNYDHPRNIGYTTAVFYTINVE